MAEEITKQRLYKITTGMIHSKGIGYDSKVDNFKVIAVDAEDAIRKLKSQQNFSSCTDEREVIESVELISSINYN